MATTRLRVIIDASAQAALKAINSVGKAVVDMGDQTTKTGSVTSKAFSGLGRAVSATTKTVAVGWTAAAGAVAGTAVSAFKTGMEFNTLQQKANASFTTILGSAKAADKMMASISKFADTSPFPRQVFIQAAQQMAAFGIKADKIVPIMGAVQDAVAAAGGSSQDISEIVTVLSQIQSAGKITGTDIMQLGQHGIDAASLIGSSMGKTGAQVKDAITKGSIGAEDAIDALTKGMSKKFGGAAANVKKTWVGTKDSVNAAIRDIGAAMSAPFIDPKGGGLLVEWGNTVADILRKVRDIVRQIMPQIMKDFGGSFDGIGAILDKINGALGKVDFSSFSTKIKDIAPVLGTLTGAFAAISGGLASNVPVIGKLLGGLGGPFGIIASAIAGLIATSPELQKVFSQTISKALDALAPAVAAVGDALVTLTPFLSDVIEAVLPLIPAIADLASNFLTTLLPPLLTIAQTALPPLIAGLEWVADALADVMSNQGVANVLAGIAGALLAMGAASKAVGLVSAAMNILRARAVGTAIGLAALKVQELAVAAGAGIATAAQWLWNVAMNANPIGLIIAGIVALVAAFVILWNKSDAFRNFFIGMWKSIQNVAATVWDAIRSAAAAVFDWIKSHWPLLVAILTGPIGAAVVLIVKNWDTIKSAALAVWSAITGAAQATWSAILTAASAVWSVLQSIWGMLANAGTSVWNAIRGVAVTVFGVIKTVAQVVFAAIMAYVRAFGAVFRAVFLVARSVATAVWRAIRSVVQVVIAGIKAYLSGMLALARAVFNAVRSVAAAAFNAVRSVVSSVIGSVKSILRSITAVAGSVFRGIRSTASSVFGSIRSIVSGAIGGIKAIIRTLSSTFSSVFSTIKGIASRAMSAIKSVVSGAVSGIKSIISGIGDGFRAAFDRAKAIVRSAIDSIKGMISGVTSALSGVMGFVDRVKSAIGRIKVPGFMKKIVGMTATAPSSAAVVPTGYRTLTAPSTNTNPASRGDLQGAVGGLMGQVTRLGSGLGDVRVININVTGALDPAAVARQIDSLLTRSDRRRGGVRVGRGPTA